MTKIFRSFLFLILGCSLQGLAQEAKLSPDQQMILDLEIKWMTAVAEKDSAVLQELLGKNFELAKIGGLGSTTIKREKWIHNYMNMNWSKFRFKRMQITIDSNLAFVNTQLSFKLAPYPFRLSSGVLDVWKKTNGKWLVEKRYLSQDNLSRWLLITEGIVIGIVILVLYRWIKSFFPEKKRDDD